MNTTEILVVLGCAAMFAVLGLLTRVRAPNLLLRADPDAPSDDGADGSRCGACAAPCKTPEADDA